MKNLSEKIEIISDKDYCLWGGYTISTPEQQTAVDNFMGSQPHITWLDSIRYKCNKTPSNNFQKTNKYWKLRKICGDILKYISVGSITEKGTKKLLFSGKFSGIVFDKNSQFALIGHREFRRSNDNEDKGREINSIYLAFGNRFHILRIAKYGSGIKIVPKSLIPLSRDVTITTTTFDLTRGARSGSEKEKNKRVEVKASFVVENCGSGVSEQRIARLLFKRNDDGNPLEFDSDITL